MRIFTIGRSPECDLVLSSTTISGKHAEVTIDENNTMVFIDHSTNGSYVNGQFLQRANRVVTAYDVIKFPDGTVLDWKLVNPSLNAKTVNMASAQRTDYQQNHVQTPVRQAPPVHQSPVAQQPPVNYMPAAPVPPPAPSYQRQPDPEPVRSYAQPASAPSQEKKLYIETSIADSLPLMVKNELANMPSDKQNYFVDEYKRKKKSVGMAYFFTVLCLGIPYGYLGRWGMQFVYWFTGAGFFIWWLIILFKLPSMVRDYNKDVALEVMRNLKIMG